MLKWLFFGKFYPFCDATFPQLTCIIWTGLSHEEIKFLDFIITLLPPSPSLSLPPPPSTLILSLLRRGEHPTCRRGSLMGTFLRHRCLNYQGQAHYRCRRIIKTLLPSPLHTLLLLLLRRGGYPTCRKGSLMGTFHSHKMHLLVIWELFAD